MEVGGVGLERGVGSERGFKDLMDFGREGVCVGAIVRGV